MQFITLDQRIAVENFEVGLIYTVTFSNGDSFTGACIGIGPDFVAFQRTAPKLLFCLTMTTAADVASIDPLGSDIGKILEYTGSVPVSIKTDGSPLLAYTIKGNELPGTGDKTANLFDINATPTKYSQSTTVTVVGQTLTILGAWYIYYEIAVAPNTDYYVNWTIDYAEIQGRGTIAIITASGQTITQQRVQQFSFNSGENQRIRLYIYSGNNEPATVIISNLMLNTGSTALPYEPFGVKIPILSGDTITNIYLDNPLRKSLDGTAVDELSSNGKLTQRVDTDGSVLSTPIISYIDIPTIPTTDGLNIFDIDTTVKPSEVYIKYFSPLFRR